MKSVVAVGVLTIALLLSAVPAAQAGDEQKPDTTPAPASVAARPLDSELWPELPQLAVARQSLNRVRAEDLPNTRDYSPPSDAIAEAMENLETASSRIGAAGIWFDPDSAEIVVNVVVQGAEPDAVAMAAARDLALAAAPAAKFRINPVSHTLRELEAIKTDVRQNGTYPWAAELNVEVGGTTVDERLNAVMVEVTSLPAGLQQRVADRWGDSVRLRLGVGPIVEQSSLHDTSPFWGGTTFAGSVSGVCATSFPGTTKIGTTSYPALLTAGHCARSSTTGYINGFSFPLVNRAYATSGASGDSVALRVPSGTNTGSSIYVSNTTSRSVYDYVASSSDIAVSVRFAISRAYTYFAAGKTMELTDLFFWQKDGICKDHAGDAGQTCGVWSWGKGGDTGGTWTTEGDSGDPIYAIRSDGAARAIGTHIGVAVQQVCSGVTCNHIYYMMPIYTAMAQSKFTPRAG